MLWGSTVGYPSDSLASCLTSVTTEKYLDQGQCARAISKKQIPCKRQHMHDIQWYMFKLDWIYPNLLIHGIKVNG